MNWINVKDAKPVYGKKVLVRMYFQAELEQGYDGADKFTDEDGDTRVYLDEFDGFEWTPLTQPEIKK